jgi:hypothetical protein
MAEQAERRSLALLWPDDEYAPADDRAGTPQGGAVAGEVVRGELAAGTARDGLRRHKSGPPDVAPCLP